MKTIFRYIVPIIMIALSSCHRDEKENIIETYPQTDMLKKNTVLLYMQEKNFGDIIYYDKILEAIATECHKNNFELMTFRADADTTNIEYLQEDFENYEIFENKLLVIFAGNEWEKLLEKITIEKKDNCQIVLLESRKKIDNVNSIYISLYGTSYITGKLMTLYDVPQDFCVVVGNENEPTGKDVYEGFCQGYGQKVTKDVLSETTSGRNIPDTAYRRGKYYENFDFVIAACGKSGLGINRYNFYNKSNKFGIINVETDANYSLFDTYTFSIIKKIDLVINNIVEHFKNNEKQDGVSYYGLSNGYTDIQAGSYQDQANEWIEEYKNEAIQKEEEYEKQYE